MFEDIVFSNESRFNKKREGSKAQDYLKKFRNDPEWSMERIKCFEDQMEVQFMEMIDNRFVDHVYAGNRSRVTK